SAERQRQPSGTKDIKDVKDGRAGDTKDGRPVRHHPALVVLTNVRGKFSWSTTGAPRMPRLFARKQVLLS
ncbi:hypothetical protein, partial [Actinoplanes sp. NPDC051411]|uniref:hypothetical protein n=1 Tax=Actinoplanes sp. NPDC051411 TaxID=3155522 RepID=UPI0034317DEA